MDDEHKGASSPVHRPNYRSLYHQILAKLLEIVLTPVDVTVESEIRVMSDPPRADILLLRRSGKQWSDEQRKLLPDGVRDRNAGHHLLECKFSESFNELALQQALGYDYFYRQTQRLKAGELQTYVVSAQTPRKALLNRLGYRGEQPGVYITSVPILEKVVLLVLNELSDEPHNEFLRLFASRQTVRKQTIDDVLQQPSPSWPDSFWAVFFGLQRIYQLEDTAVKREMTVEDVMEIGAELRRQAIVSASPEERLAGLAPEERLAGLAPEERLAGLAPEEMAALMEQIEALLGKKAAGQTRHRTRSGKR